MPRKTVVKAPAKQPVENRTALLANAQKTLRLTQPELGALVAVPHKVITRWLKNNGIAKADASVWRKLAVATYPRDNTLAERLAAVAGTTLIDLGVVMTPELQYARQMHLVDSIVCAAAEAIGMAPQAVRPSLLAAFERAGAVGLEIEEVRDALKDEARNAAARGK